ncbi:MAG: hypothetical protein F6J98_37340 [Moorea sp. SIO4G2]|nr:hypothetical protein [Moorena sp. SIO4G2]
MPTLQPAVVRTHSVGSGGQILIPWQFHDQSCPFAHPTTDIIPLTADYITIRYTLFLLFPLPSSLLPAPKSLLRSPCSLKTQNFVPN